LVVPWVGERLLMFEHAVYTVATPEACAFFGKMPGSPSPKITAWDLNWARPLPGTFLGGAQPTQGSNNSQAGAAAEHESNERATRR